MEILANRGKIHGTLRVAETNGARVLKSRRNLRTVGRLRVKSVLIVLFDAK